MLLDKCFNVIWCECVETSYVDFVRDNSLVRLRIVVFAADRLVDLSGFLEARMSVRCWMRNPTAVADPHLFLAGDDVLCICLGYRLDVFGVADVDIDIHLNVEIHGEGVVVVGRVGKWRLEV